MNIPSHVCKITAGSSDYYAPFHEQKETSQFNSRMKNHSGKRLVIDNSPVFGWKLTDKKEWNNYIETVKVEHPDGHIVNILAGSFVSASTEGIVDNVLQGKFSLAWNKTGKDLLLIDESWEEYSQAINRLFIAETVKLKDLKPGWLIDTGSDSHRVFLGMFWVVFAKTDRVRDGTRGSSTYSYTRIFKGFSQTKVGILIPEYSLEPDKGVYFDFVKNPKITRIRNKTELSVDNINEIVNRKEHEADFDNNWKSYGYLGFGKQSSEVIAIGTEKYNLDVFDKGREFLTL